MDDNELMTAIRDRFDAVHLHIPAETIMARGRPPRRRRVLAGAVATAGAAAALAVTALLPASGPATVTLAAWTVSRAPDGTVTVTVRELRDPAGLQATLRADGVPASVWSLGRPNPACHAPAGTHTQALGRVYSFPPQPGNQDVVVIHPAALPPGTGVSLAAQWQRSGRPHQELTPLGQRSAHPPHQVKAMTALVTGLVGISKQCTGR